MTGPQYETELNKRLGKFRDWLVANGSAIHAPTNPYEVLRFDGPGAVCVVYKNASGQLSWQNGAAEAFAAFRDCRPWRATDRVARANRGTAKRLRLIRSLMHRDGARCLYCPAELTEETATVEHVVSITSGGSSHMANLALACDRCNDEASHLSVVEKIRLAIRRGNGDR